MRLLALGIMLAVCYGGVVACVHENGFTLHPTEHGLCARSDRLANDADEIWHTLAQRRL